MSILPQSDDWTLAENIWDIENHELKVEAVGVFHPTVQHGIEEDEYSAITAAELYGMLRHWEPQVMLLTETSPIMVVLIYEDELDPLDYYTIDYEEFDLLKNFYVGSGIRPEESIDWIKEGF